MTDKAALLRAYHAALSKALTAKALDKASRLFMLMTDRDGAPVTHPDDLFKAHLDRVNGQGSPAACDEALARALREIGT